MSWVSGGCRLGVIVGALGCGVRWVSSVREGASEGGLDLGLVG